MDAKTYRVKTLPADTATTAIDWSAIPAADVAHYAWCEGYTPAVTAQLVYVAGDRFVLRMRCVESNPRATYTAYMENVYEDSCMEFFADWLGDGRYINMEMNANGTLLSCIGPDKFTRTPVAEFTGGVIFPVTADVQADAWSVVADIPLSLLARILGVEKPDVASGFAFRGNFYKCGDATAIPHFGMWNPVELPSPNFHCPAFFGNIVVD